MNRSYQTARNSLGWIGEYVKKFEKIEKNLCILTKKLTPTELRFLSENIANFVNFEKTHPKFAIFWLKFPDSTDNFHERVFSVEYRWNQEIDAISALFEKICHNTFHKNTVFEPREFLQKLKNMLFQLPWIEVKNSEKIAYFTRNHAYEILKNSP